MKTLNTLLSVIVMTILFFGCKFDTKDTLHENGQDVNEQNTAKPISIITRSMEIQMADTIPSGWNTFKYENDSNETHFVVFEKYPEGKTLDSTKAQVFPVFDKGMDLINAGKREEGFAAFNNLPAWFFEVVFQGGTGLVSPHGTAVSSMYLDPGRYLVECYVKMPNGKFHSVMGMYKELTVNQETAATEEPKPTVEVEISAEKGMVFHPDIRAGEQVFKVHFRDQKLHENFLGHDVHLVKLSGNSNMKALEEWMNWTDPKGLMTPSPVGVTFMGGIQEMPAGKVGYFKAKLSKGTYALISEVPSAGSKQLLKQFEVLD